MIRQRNIGSNFLKDDFFDEIILSQLTAFALPGRLQAFADTIEGVVRTVNDPEWHVHHRLEEMTGKFNRSSQHSGIGGCYDGTQTAVGSVWTEQVAFARSTGLGTA